jgi:ADP-ribose pyrophosphatase YjhB (NUDIX family)
MITANFDSFEIQPLAEQSSSTSLVESNLSVVLEPNNILDRSVALIIDNSGKILLVQSVRQDTEEALWGIPTNTVTGSETPAEAVARGLQASARFNVAHNHLLSLGSIESDVEDLNRKIYLFLHKTSQVRYSPPYGSTVPDKGKVRWLHKVRLAESIRNGEITDFGTVSLFAKAVLLGII